MLHSGERFNSLNAGAQLAPDANSQGCRTPANGGCHLMTLCRSVADPWAPVDCPMVNCASRIVKQRQYVQVRSWYSWEPAYFLLGELPEEERLSQSRQRKAGSGVGYTIFLYIKSQISQILC